MYIVHHMEIETALFALTGVTDLTVQLFIQLTDALCQLCQLFCDDCMMNRLRCVCFHIKFLSQEISIAL